MPLKQAGQDTNEQGEKEHLLIAQLQTNRKIYQAVPTPDPKEKCKEMPTRKSKREKATLELLVEGSLRIENSYLHLHPLPRRLRYTSCIYFNKLT